MKRKWILWGTISAVLMASLGSYLLWTRSPAYSLKQLAVAIKQHDRDGVEKFIDIDAVVNHALDAWMEEASLESDSESGWEAAGQVMAFGLFQLMKPRVTSFVKESFLSYVETGDFRDTEGRGELESGFLTLLRRGVSSTSKVLEVVSVRKDGKLALVTIRLLTNDQDEILPEIKMRNKGTHWQVVGIQNFSDVIGSAPDTQ